MPPNRMIGVALGLRTTAEAIAGIRSVARSADIAEIRLDYMDECDLPALLRDRPCPVIVTNRAEREGGRFRGSESERLRPLLEAIDLGVDYVDIEHDAAHLLEDRQDTKLVISRHDFERIPDDITEVHRRLAGKGADVVKIVGMAQRLTDNIRILQALALSDLPMIGIAMGEAGLISRILALKHGSCFLTYATLEEDNEVAPGQLPVETMRNVYRAKQIGVETAVYGVLSARRISDSLVSGLNSGDARCRVRRNLVAIRSIRGKGRRPGRRNTSFSEPGCRWVCGRRIGSSLGRRIVGRNFVIEFGWRHQCNPDSRRPHDR